VASRVSSKSPTTVIGEAIKRPLSAYFLFSAEVKESIQEKPEFNGDVRRISKETARQWQALSIESKRVYESRSLKQREEYQADLV